jgi:hypothetical protein
MRRSSGSGSGSSECALTASSGNRQLSAYAVPSLWPGSAEQNRRETGLLLLLQPRRRVPFSFSSPIMAGFTFTVTVILRGEKRIHNVGQCNNLL